MNFITDPRFPWYVSRSAGLVSIALLTATVMLGTVGVWQKPLRKWPLFATHRLHQSISLLALSLVAVHTGSLLFDKYVSFNLSSFFVPFTADYRPFWVGLGAIGFDLLVILVVTSLGRRFFSSQVWAVLHRAAYACWPVAIIHGLKSGTDATTGLGSWFIVICCILGVTSIAIRVIHRFRSSTKTTHVTGNRW